MLLSGVSIYHNHNLSLPKIPSNFPKLQDSSGIGTLAACVFQAPVVRESLLTLLISREGSSDERMEPLQ